MVIPMQRVAMIGLDAAEPELIERMMAAGQLPTLARLKQRSAHCRLHSEATWRSGRVWETFLTGEADFASAALFEPATYASFQLGSRKKAPFYAQVPRAKLVALDVPYLSLWHDTPGIQVIWGGHDAGYPRASRPAGLLREIDARCGVHPAFHNDFSCAWHHAESINVLADALLTGLRRRVKVARWLLEREPDWNLFLTVLSEAHSAGEIFWHGLGGDHPLAHTPTAALAKRRLEEVYRELDRAVGALQQALPAETTLVVTSVHGMEMNHYDVPSMALLPELLHRAHFGRGLLSSTNAAVWRWRGSPPVLPGSRQKWTAWMKEHFNVQPARRWLTAWKRALGLRRHHGRPIEELAVPIPPETDLPPEQIAEPRWPLNWQTTCWYREHWPRMKAFALPVFYDGRVRINLQGREGEGVVPIEEYRATCDWVIKLLEECRDARTGGPVLAGVERPRWRDPLDPAGPDADLVLTWHPAVDAFVHPRLGLVGPVPFRRTGGHTDRGFAYLAGPGIAAQDLGQREALHLTPTLLDLLGQPRAHSFLPRRAAAA
ncbi:MAG: alkaline phosphatase family protein [Pirellulaceae bacterium]|nr:alkaline phosphatase family protein [Pirellulaceae bacterium]